ncbi:MAG: hypothetical protein WCA39_14030, partial [Nitrososphaeraceae archaeon]
IKENPKLLSAIDWINKNTQPNATIIGASHLRGWMELELENDRTFHFFNNNDGLVDFLRNSKSQNSYLFALNEGPDLRGVKVKNVYSSEIVTIWRVYSHMMQTAKVIDRTRIK